MDGPGRRPADADVSGSTSEDVDLARLPMRSVDPTGADQTLAGTNSLELRPTTVAGLSAIGDWEQDPDTGAWLGETGHAWHRASITDPTQDHLVAVVDDVPVGFGVLAGADGGGSVELRRMVLDPAVRGRGLGRALLTALTDRAHEHHRARRVWLDVKPANARALALYESGGFVVERTARAAVREPDGSWGDLLVLAHRAADPSA